MKRILRSILISIALLSITCGGVSPTKLETAFAVENGQQKIKKAMPKGHHWVISQSERVKFDQKTEYVISGAFCDRGAKGQGAKIFIIANNSNGNQLLRWESSWFEATSILSVNLYLIKTADRTLVVGEYASGGARGTMNDIDILILNKNGQVKLIKRLELGIGNVNPRDGYIEVEGELLGNPIVLSFENGVYAEESKTVITDIKNWNHPTKKIFKENSVLVQEIKLQKNNTYPVFYIQLPSASKLRHEAYFEEFLAKLAFANGFWNYELVDKQKTFGVTVLIDRTGKKIINADYKNKKSYIKIFTKVRSWRLDNILRKYFKNRSGNYLIQYESLVEEDNTVYMLLHEWFKNNSGSFSTLGWYMLNAENGNLYKEEQSGNKHKFVKNVTNLQ